MARGPVLVLGATGNVGGAVVGALVAAGVQVRAAGTDAARVARAHPGVVAVRVDLRAPDTFVPALAGVESVFVVRPPAIGDVAGTVNAFLSTAEVVGVQHVVFSSVAGADRNRLLPHHRIEQHLMASSLPWTILRPGFFAQNLADAYGTDVRERGQILVPAGAGRVAFVDTRDVGEVAGVVLEDARAHAGAQYLLTGPVAVTFDHVAQIISRYRPEPVRYVPMRAGAYVRHLRAGRAPWAQTLVQTALHVGLRYGQGAVVDPTLGDLLGRPARTIEQYVHDHQHLWRPPGRTSPR